MKCLQLLMVAVAGGLIAAPASAANIVWVTPHETGPTAAAMTAGFTESPDIGYTNLLTGGGHSVSRFLVPATGANAALSPTQLAVLNAADLVIIGRSSNSGSFDNAAEVLSWNADVTKPMIVTTGYVTRNSRLGYTTGGTIPDIAGTTRFLATNPAHPVFQGITLNGSNETDAILDIMSFNGTPQRGTSINNNPIVAGGTLIASITSDNAAAANGPVIAEFPAGTASSFGGGGTFAGKRMLFTTGSREVDGGNSETAGILDLSSAGQTMFLNAVCYMAVGGCTPVVLGDTDGDLIGGEFPDDFDPIKLNFRKAVSSRAQGDLVADGIVDFKDFRQWKTAYLGGGGSLAGIDFGFLANVPEPGSALLLIIALATIVGARGRRRR